MTPCHGCDTPLCCQHEGACMRPPPGPKAPTSGPTPAAQTTTCATGAVRSADANGLRFDLIHPLGQIALARTLAEGATKYADMNWEQGFPVHDLLNHVHRHLCLYEAGDRSEPHLAHALCGLHFAVVSDALWPELNESHLRGPGCTLTPEIKARLDREKDEKTAARARGEFRDVGEWDLRAVPEAARILEQRKEALGGH